MSRLEVLSPPSLTGETRDLWGGAVLVGRGSDADWRLGEPTVSRHHAVVRHFADHDEIEDLGSLSRTLVNGRRIDGPVVLRPGDVVELAVVRLRYVADDLDDDAEPAAAGTPTDEPAAAEATTAVRLLVTTGVVLACVGMLVLLGALALSMARAGEGAGSAPEIAGLPAVAAGVVVTLVGVAVAVAGVMVARSSGRPLSRR